MIDYLAQEDGERDTLFKLAPDLKASNTLKANDKKSLIVPAARMYSDNKKQKGANHEDTLLATHSKDFGSNLLDHSLSHSSQPAVTESDLDAQSLHSEFKSEGMNSEAVKESPEQILLQKKIDQQQLF